MRSEIRDPRSAIRHSSIRLYPTTKRCAPPKPSIILQRIRTYEKHLMPPQQMPPRLKRIPRSRSPRATDSGLKPRAQEPKALPAIEYPDASVGMWLSLVERSFRLGEVGR